MDDVEETVDSLYPRVLSIQIYLTALTQALLKSRALTGGDLALMKDLTSAAAQGIQDSESSSMQVVGLRVQRQLDLLFGILQLYEND